MRLHILRLFAALVLLITASLLTISTPSTALASVVSPDPASASALALIPTESPPLPERFGRSGFVDVGGYSLAYECIGDRSPTVLIEPNIGESGMSGSWQPLVERIGQQARICVYDRANMGKSDAVDGARTTQDMVNDLHMLLVSAEIPGPYVLVGHSYGGWTMRLFAAQHPDDVRALLLVDGKNPDEFAAYNSVFPQPEVNAPDEVRAIWVEMVDPDSIPENPEHFAYTESADQVKGIEYLGIVSLTVLGHDSATMSFPKSVGQASLLQGTCAELQMQLADLSWIGTYQTVIGASSRIHEEQPDIVFDALMVLVNRARREFKR